MNSVIVVDCEITCIRCGSWRTIKDHCDRGEHTEVCHWCLSEERE